jgi:hypothetical protein
MLINPYSPGTFIVNLIILRNISKFGVIILVNMPNILKAIIDSKFFAIVL